MRLQYLPLIATFLLVLTCTERLPAQPLGAVKLPTLHHNTCGIWRVTYHPNQSQRTYEIRTDGSVRFAEEPTWTGQLQLALPQEQLAIATPQQLDWKSGEKWYLRWASDSVDRWEVLTPCADGRLLVEHFNTSATALPHPDQIGIARKVVAGKVPGHSYSSTDFASGNVRPDPATELLDQTAFCRSIRLLQNNTFAPEGLVGHPVVLDVIVSETGAQPLASLYPPVEDGLAQRIRLISAGSDHTLEPGQILHVEGKLVDVRDGVWFLWHSNWNITGKTDVPMLTK